MVDCWLLLVWVGVEDVADGEAELEAILIVALGVLVSESSSDEREALAVAEIPQSSKASDSASIELYAANQESNLTATAGDKSVVKGL